MRFLSGIVLVFAHSTQTSIVLAQDDAGNPCIASNGRMTGVTPDCTSGWCRYNICASLPLAYLGDPCEDSSQCIGIESIAGYSPDCGAFAGVETRCGEDGAACRADNGDDSGLTPICTSGQCRNRFALVRIPFSPANNVLPIGNVKLGYRVSTGDATSRCFCRNNFCASTPTANLGEACFQDNQCVNAETWNDNPAYCAGNPRICGGGSARCYSDSGFESGSSSVCASGYCRRYQCTTLNPSPPGAPCEFDFGCEGRQICVVGYCSDAGLPCLASDNTLTGFTDECQAKYCRSGSCATLPSAQIGQPCDDSNQCVDAETWQDVPAACAGPSEGEKTCGGETAFCFAENGEAIGPADICASGRCRSSQCTSLIPRENGEFCQGDYQCSETSSCIRSTCRGSDGGCTVEDGTGNNQNMGPSGDCPSLFCRAGVCSNVPPATLGDECDEDLDCAGSDGQASFRSLLNCGSGEGGVKRCGSGGAPCVPLDGGATGHAPDLCISGLCSEYSCTDALVTPGFRKRGGLVGQARIPTRLCPGNLYPCPVYPKGYECIDIQNSLESCGGCVGRNLPGIDCSADVNAAEIACIRGRCVIAKCSPGYVVAVENNTCVEE
ncbi:hypothetical protein NliqN6_4418 [Naganishia liquefaciens]|uniref:Protein CPL1-like domain-containing protein n=1 Tax=Naganishia liquefaciens TaxID=104408 RepID=A0A8H3YHX1_9TREE|nr:hypothetical protein NliqN6_4418 [Naganishia liquefaciens]